MDKEIAKLVDVLGITELQARRMILARHALERASSYGRNNSVQSKNWLK